MCGEVVQKVKYSTEFFNTILELFFIIGKLKKYPKILIIYERI